MKLLKKILEKLNGLHYRQDYLCFAAETFSHPLYLYLVREGEIVKDITALHAFIGYCPVVFALPAQPGINGSTEVQTVFSPDRLAAGKKISEKGMLASLTLKKIATFQTGTGTVFYYKATRGVHHFIPGIRQLVGQLLNRLYNNKPGNVFLKGNLYQQVQIAYAVPRKISLITVAFDDKYNLFPTDLHGQINDNYYLISLRHGGKACAQVMTTGKIVLSEMKAAAYKQVYLLGKNHMQPMKDASQFDFSPNVSLHFGLPLPKDAVAWKELQLESAFDAGIHRLLLFRIVAEGQIATAPETLVHVHNVYATWRDKKGWPGNYLLR